MEKPNKDYLLLLLSALSMYCSLHACDSHVKQGLLTFERLHLPGITQTLKSRGWDLNPQSVFLLRFVVTHLKEDEKRKYELGQENVYY